MHYAVDLERQDVVQGASGADHNNALLPPFDQHVTAVGLRAHLGNLGAAVPRDVWSHAVVAPLRDFLGRRGKNFRARTVSYCWTFAGGIGAAPPALGALVEYMHAGSLIIDDIQDGAVERRGGPSLHQRYGMPLALCLGNWLYFFPFTILEQMKLPPAIELAMTQRMTASMLRGHYGQALDLTVRCYGVPQAELPGVVDAITEWKTATLFELAAACGALPAGSSAERLATLTRFGRCFGQALQNLDDLGSLRSPLRASKREEDLRGARATYAWALLAEKLDEKTFAEFQARARRCEAGEEETVGFAHDICDVVEQEGMRRVLASLDSVLADLRKSLGPSAVLTEVEDEFARLVASFG